MSLLRKFLERWTKEPASRGAPSATLRDVEPPEEAQPVQEPAPAKPALAEEKNKATAAVAASPPDSADTSETVVPQSQDFAPEEPGGLRAEPRTMYEEEASGASGALEDSSSLLAFEIETVVSPTAGVSALAPNWAAPLDLLVPQPAGEEEEQSVSPDVDRASRHEHLAGDEDVEAFDQPSSVSSGDDDQTTPSTPGEPLELGFEPSDPLITDLVSLNETSVRLRNAISVAAAHRALPFINVSKYFLAGEEAPEIVRRHVANLGRKSMEELDALLRRARAEISEARRPAAQPTSADEPIDLRLRLASALSGDTVEVALVELDVPVRLWNALSNDGLLERPLQDFVYSFPELMRELRRAPNVGRTSIEAARTLLGGVIRRQLADHGVAGVVAEDAEAFLLDEWEPDPASRAALAAACSQLPVSSAQSAQTAQMLSRDQLRQGLATFFEGRTVANTIAQHDPPARLPNALERLGYSRAPLSVLLLEFNRRQAELLRLPNLGRRSVRAGEDILTRIVRDELSRRGFTGDEVDDAVQLLVGDKSLPPNAAAALYARLLDVTGLAPSLVEDAAAEPSPPPPREAAQSVESLVPQLLATLLEREREVIERRYGLIGPRETLEEIGQAFAVTRERIRQIEKKALGRLRQRGQRRLKAAVLELGGEAWEALAKGEPVLLESELFGYTARVSPYFLIAIGALGWTLRTWLDQFAMRRDDFWALYEADADRIQQAIEELQRVSITRPLPYPLEALFQAAQPNDAKLAARAIGRRLYGDYLLAERSTSRVRRAVGLHSILGSQGLLSLSELLPAYHTQFPGDPCSFRDAEISMQAHRHLFVETIEGSFVAIGRSGSTPRETVEQRAEDEAEAAEGGEATATDLTISGALEAELRAMGPLRVSELVDRAPDFLPPGRSLNSIGPVLITTKDVFARPLPGFYALHHQLPLGGDLLRSPPKFIFQEDQVRIYALARHAGEPWGAFPYWNAEVEYHWAHWARRYADPALLESFLAIMDVDAWPDGVTDPSEWAELKAARGHFQLEHPPVLERVNRPDLERLFAAALQLRHRGHLGWMSANRILWGRVTDSSAVGVLATLVALKALEPAASWQKPHAAGPQLDHWLAKMDEAWSLTGRLRWEDELGQSLLEAARSFDPAQLGWIDEALLRRLLGKGAAPPPASEPEELDPLEQLLAERREAQRDAERLAAFRSLHGAGEGD